MLLCLVIRVKLDYTILKLQLVNDGINCPNCNEYTSTIHQTRSILVRDLSIVGRLVYLKIPRRLLGETHAEETSARFHPQFRCNNCKKSPTEILSWLNRKQRQTNRYQEYIYERVSVAGDPRRKELT